MISRRLPTVLLLMALLLTGVLSVAPVGVMIVQSLTSPGHTLSLEAYTRLWQQTPLVSVMVMSVVIAVLTTAGHLLVAGLTAYGLSRTNLPGKPWLKLVYLVTMMIPVQVNLVPLFFLMRELHWLDTPMALVIPGWFGAFGFLFLAEWMDGIPTSLDEAARLDGCTPLQTWWRVIMPMCRPALVTIGLLLFINTWNSFVWPLLVMQSPQWQTLPVAIASLKSSYREAIDWPVVMAACTVSTVPLLVLFACGQKALLGGMVAGSVKE
jgi:multiple sugar transport system permease protein